MTAMDHAENLRRMQAGELYHAFTPELVAARRRCELACSRFNEAGEATRRKRVELWRDIIGDTTPLLPLAAAAEEDELLFANDPWIHGPIHIDYGTNVKVGSGVFINFNCTILDTCLVTIGARSLLGPNVSLYSGTHPEDPVLRDGTNGPELGLPITIGEDVWIGGNAMILPGVKIGKGSIVGAGSVVTRNVPDHWIVAGNPARLLRRVKTSATAPQSLPVQTQSNANSSSVPTEATATDDGSTENPIHKYSDEDQGW